MSKSLLTEALQVGTQAANAQFHSGVVDPSAVGFPAPIGSGYLSTASGAWWRKTGALDTDWTPVSGGASSTVINELWGPRSSPHAADDEFDTGALGAAWLQTGFGATLDFGTRPAPYVIPLNTPASWENLRGPDNATDNSWLRIQPGGGLSGIWQPLNSAAFGGAVPANLLAWTRVRFSWLNTVGVAAGDADIGLSFFNESGGGWSFAEHSTLNANNTQEGAVANVIKALFWGRDGGTITSVSETARMNEAATNRAVAPFFSGYLGVQKIGNVYHGWMLDDGGRLYMGAYTNGGAGCNAIALWCRGNGSGAGIPIFDIDFIRFYEGSDWLP